MKYTNQLPITDKNLSSHLLSDNWKKIKEPSNLNLAILSSLPFAIINLIIFSSIIYIFYPNVFENFKNMFTNLSFSLSFNMNFFTLIYIILIFLFMVIHEFTHLLFIPNFLKSDKTFWSFKFTYAVVYTTEKIKKSRYLIISIAPFIIFSILVPIVLSILNFYNPFLLFLSFLNCIGASVDCLTIFLIITQVPNNSYIVNNGFETYYKN